MMKTINAFIDATTMYRVVLYTLTALTLIAVILSLFHQISYSTLSLLASLFVLLSVCFATNAIFSKILGAPTNIESSFVTAYILFLIITPGTTLVALGWTALAGFIAMSSKYLIAWRKKHIFNPAALALVLLALLGQESMMWWVGSLTLLPFTLIASLLVVKKLRRFPLFFTYIIVSTFAVEVNSYIIGAPLGDALIQHFTSWPTIFLAGIMLTEPLTIPGTHKLQMAYGALIGLLSSIPFHMGSLYGTPELAIIIANIIFYPTSLKQRIELIFVKKNVLAKDTYEFIFKSKIPFTFKAGQYLEWMLPHENPDLRGVRRYFTIASSPTEPEIRLGIKCAPPLTSTYKQHLMNMEPGETMYAGGRAGDFILPADTSKKLAFIAGGIGVTPFRSIVKNLIDTNDRRDITLFYSNKTPEDIAYREIFEEATEKLGMKIVYLINSGTITDAHTSWEQGFLTADMLKKHLPDLSERGVYISGPDAMVDAYTKLLNDCGVSTQHITRDYFSGYA